jgi:hypothetical protein
MSKSMATLEAELDRLQRVCERDYRRVIDPKVEDDAALDAALDIIEQVRSWIDE